MPKTFIHPAITNSVPALRRTMLDTEYQPKTGAQCSCKRGVQRDNCPNCEGTGWVIDFKRIRDRNKKEA